MDWVSGGRWAVVCKTIWTFDFKVLKYLLQLIKLWYSL